MYNYINKIDKSLYTIVTTEGFVKHECIVFVRDYPKYKNLLYCKRVEFCEFPFVRAFGLKLNQKEIVDFAKNQAVVYITKNAKVQTQVFVSKKILGLDALRPYNMQGKGSTIAIIDTGVYPHIDFVLGKNRIVKFVDMINGRDNPYDDNGHGTMVTSLACGSGYLHNKKYSGVSPLADIVVIKAIEGSGETSSIKILEAMQWIYNNHKKYNISVVCMSFGSNPVEGVDPLVIGAESLWNIGIVVVAAAGNSGPEKNSIKSPGISPKIITVGGLDDKRIGDNYREDNFCIADFSSRGGISGYTKPDLIAPAVNIVGASSSGGYTSMSGTSVATPLIAGVCALIKGKYPRLTPNQVKLRLVKSCKKIPASFSEDGYGVVDMRLFLRQNILQSSD